MTGRINGLSRIGILGGTFNPIHFGHLIMAEQAREFLGLEKVLLIPSGNSYMKDPAQILPAEKRYEMACLAARGNPHFLVSDMEIRRGGDSYTCETLRELKVTCAGAELFYIVGADTLFGIESWKAPEEIFSSCVLAVAVRDGCADEALNQKAEELTQRYNARIRMLPECHIEISSTQIRQRIREGQSIRYLVPEPVRQFIEQNGLYR